MDRTPEFLEVVGVSGTAARRPLASSSGSSSSSKVMRKLTVLVVGIDRTEARLREVGSDYATPSFAVGEADRMSDADRDALEAQMTGFLVECRAVLDEIGREPPASGARGAFEGGALRVALDKTKILSATFNDLQQLRYHRDLKRHHSTAPTTGDDPWKRRYVEETTRRPPEATRPPPEATRPPSEAPPRDIQGQQQQQSEQQRAMLQKERDLLASEVEEDLDAAKRLESRMHQISQLMSTFSSLVSEQQETIANLFDVVEETVEVVDRGGDQLQRAAKRPSAFPVFFNAIVLGAAFALLLLHWLRP